jgi:hypothetical protein
MDSIILVILPYLEDIDKMHLISTCSELWRLRFNITLNTKEIIFTKPGDITYIPPSIRKISLCHEVKILCGVPESVTNITSLFTLPYLVLKDAGTFKKVTMSNVTGAPKTYVFNRQCGNLTIIDCTLPLAFWYSRDQSLALPWVVF